MLPLSRSTLKADSGPANHQILRAASIAVCAAVGAVVVSSSLATGAAAQIIVTPEPTVVNSNATYPLENHACIADTPEILQATYGIHPLSENDLFTNCDPRRPFCVLTDGVYRTGYTVVTLKSAVSGDDLILQNGDPYTIVQLDQNYSAPADRKMKAAAVAPLRVVYKTENLFGSGLYCTGATGTVANMVGGQVACRAGAILTDAKRNYLINTIAPAGAALLSTRLSVTSVNGNLFVPSTRICGTQYIGPQSDVTSGVPNADVVVYLSGAPSSPGVIAWAGACATDRSGRPTVAKVNVVPDFLDPNQNEVSRTYITRVMVHELMHALGFSGPYMASTQFANGGVRTATRRGKTVTLFTGPRTLQAARDYWNCQSLDGVELEDEGAVGTSGSHWERKYAYDDVMSGIAGQVMQFSPITLAVFQDSGKYTVNFGNAEEQSWLKGAGCNVFSQTCGTAAGGLGTWFCGSSSGAQCAANMLAIGQCNIGTFSTDLPTWFRYFASPRQGGTEPLMDYCPVVGQFSNRICADSSSNRADNTQGFYYGPGGRCWRTSATFTANGWGFGSTNPGPARCFQSRCLNGVQVQFTVGTSGNWISCPADGSVATISSATMQTFGYTGEVTCPLASTFCTPDLLFGSATTTTPRPTTPTTTPTTTTPTTTTTTTRPTTTTTTTTTTRPTTTTTTTTPTTTTTTRPTTTPTTTTRPTTTPTTTRTTTTVPPTQPPTTTTRAPTAPPPTTTTAAANCNYLLPSNSAPQSASLSIAQINQILRRHNEARSAVKPYAMTMPPLQWNRDLANLAQTYLDQCPGLVSSSQSSRLDKLGWWYVGENMVGGPTLSQSTTGIDLVMDAWINPRASWTYPTTCASGVYCGAYQQVIWADTTQVGCAFKQCNDRYRYYWVCNYGVGGNVFGANPYQSTPYLSLSAGCTADRAVSPVTSAPNDQCRASYALTGTSPSSVLSTANINQLLDGHNQLRRTVSPFARTMPMLKWNQQLANLAQSYLATCPGLRTSPTSSRLSNSNFPQWWWIGENMIAGEDLRPTFIDDVLNAWSDGLGGFVYGQSCLPGYYCGAYLNMIWADTTDMGCAYQYCPNDTSGNPHYWVCNYGVGGNILGANPYQSTTNRNEAASCTTFDSAASGRRMHAMEADGSQMMRSGRVMTLAAEAIDMDLAAQHKKAE